MVVGLLKGQNPLSVTKEVFVDDPLYYKIDQKHNKATKVTTNSSFKFFLLKKLDSKIL